MWSRSDWELCAFSEAQKVSPTGVGHHTCTYWVYNLVHDICIKQESTQINV